MQLVVEQKLKNMLPQIAFRLGDMATVVQRDNYIGGERPVPPVLAWRIARRIQKVLEGAR